MHRLNTILVGITSLLAATAVAQALDTGAQDRTTIAQAQTGGQDPMNGRDPVNGQSPMGGQGSTGSSVMDRMNEGTAGNPAASPSQMDKAQGGYHPQGRSAKQDPARGGSYQARKSKKPESRDSGE